MRSFLSMCWSRSRRRSNKSAERRNAKSGRKTFARLANTHYVICTRPVSIAARSAGKIDLAVNIMPW